MRAGFHRTTMQDVAAEAKMSPGNLYRYSPPRTPWWPASPSATGPRSRTTSTRLVGTEDFLESFAALGRKHFEEKPREKAILCLEIWAEATRNPTFAAITSEFERDMSRPDGGALPPGAGEGPRCSGVDLRALAMLISTLADGLFVRRAILAELRLPSARSPP